MRLFTAFLLSLSLMAFTARHESFSAVPTDFNATSVVVIAQATEQGQPPQHRGSGRLEVAIAIDSLVV